MWFWCRFERYFFTLWLCNCMYQGNGCKRVWDLQCYCLLPKYLVLVLDWKSTWCHPSTVSTCTCKFEKYLYLTKVLPKLLDPKPDCISNMLKESLENSDRRKSSENLFSAALKQAARHTCFFFLVFCLWTDGWMDRHYHDIIWPFFKWAYKNRWHAYELLPLAISRRKYKSISM